MAGYRSYSKLLAYEASRILFRLGCDVRVYDPLGLPVKDDQRHDHPKVQELRELSKWSDGHVWVSPEQHGTLVCFHAYILTTVPTYLTPRTPNTDKVGFADCRL
jgi:arsenic resistance protein ArsH